MRDYYAEYLGQKPGNIPTSEVSKVAKEGSTEAESAFATFDTLPSLEDVAIIAAEREAIQLEGCGLL